MNANIIPDKKILVKGLPLEIIKNKKEAYLLAKKLFLNQTGGYSVAINAEKMIRSLESKEFFQIVNNAQIHVPDGILPVILARLKGVKTKRVDFPKILLETADALKSRIAVIGTTEKNLELAINNIEKSYPQLKVVFVANGFKRDSQVSTDLLKVDHIDLILIGMGSPKQEEWTSKLTEILPKSFIANVGGAIDILSGQKNRAPSLIQILGLEWLYRLIQEPKRINRQLRILKIFKY